MADLSFRRPDTGPSAGGIPFLVAGIALFSVQDLILKLLSDRYPLSEAMVLRSLTSLPILVILVHVSGGLKTLRTPGWRRMVARGVLLFLAYTAYYLALAALPLATTVALYFTAPLFITIFSVLLLKETVGLRRWTAVAAGFGGVLIMLRPGTEVFDWAAVLALFSGLSYALSMIAARYLGTTESAAALAFWGNLVFLACALLMAIAFGNGEFAAQTHPSLGFLFRAWITPTTHDLLLMMACGVIASFGLTLLTQAYRITASAVVAPFEYSAMVWGVVWGWLFWRDWPDTLGWIGILIIVGAGLFVLYRESAAERPSD